MVCQKSLGNRHPLAMWCSVFKWVTWKGNGITPCDGVQVSFHDATGAKWPFTGRTPPFCTNHGEAWTTWQFVFGLQQRLRRSLLAKYLCNTDPMVQGTLKGMKRQHLQLSILVSCSQGPRNLLQCMPIMMYNSVSAHTDTTTNQPTDRPTDQPTNRPTDQPTNER